MAVRWFVGRNPLIQNGIRAGILIAAGTLGGGTLPLAYALAQPTPEPVRAVQHIDSRASLLHAGSTGADVERVLGEPTAATELGAPGSGDRALVFASEPVRTRVVLTGDRVTSIALDVVYVDPGPLPMRARAIKATTPRDGLTSQLGTPTVDHRWTEIGRNFEQMTHADADDPEFSVFLVNGLVVDVRFEHDRPAKVPGAAGRFGWLGARGRSKPGAGSSARRSRLGNYCPSMRCVLTAFHIRRTDELFALDL